MTCSQQSMNVQNGQVFSLESCKQDSDSMCRGSVSLSSRVIQVSFSHLNSTKQCFMFFLQKPYIRKTSHSWENERNAAWYGPTFTPGLYFPRLLDPFVVKKQTSAPEDPQVASALPPLTQRGEVFPSAPQGVLTQAQLALGSNILRDFRSIFLARQAWRLLLGRALQAGSLPGGPGPQVRAGFSELQR